jgi:hypothetical protein
LCLGTALALIMILGANSLGRCFESRATPGFAETAVRLIGG